MAHKVHLYDVKAGFGPDGYMRPVETLETEDAEEAIRVATEAIARTGSISASHINVDWRLTPTLEAYFHLSNATARWLADNPIEGAWIGALTEDLEHWKSMGVETPEQMEKYLLLNMYYENYRETYGVRPRDHGMTMETPIEEIEAEYDRLFGPAPDPEESGLEF